MEPTSRDPGDPGDPVRLDELEASLAPTHHLAWERGRRNGTVRRFDPVGDDAVPVLVKQLAGDLYGPATMARLLAELGAVAGSPLAPRLLAWGEEPPYLAYEFVPGPLVSEELDRLAAATVDLEVVCDLARSAGSLLARFHRLAPRPPEAAAHDPAASRLLARSLRWAGANWDAPSDHVRSVLDPGGNNLVVTATGELRMIDLPGRAELRPRVLDAAMAAQRIGREARRARRRAGGRTAGVAERVAAAVRAGYETEQGHPLDDAAFDAVLAASAAQLATKYLRRPTPGWSRREALADARWALASAARGRLRRSRRRR